MKNIQVIDGAQNCTFSVFQATDPRQDIQYMEDLAEFPGRKEVDEALERTVTRNHECLIQPRCHPERSEGPFLRP